MRHRSCRPCNVYRVLRTECGYALDGNLVASLQFPRSIETTKFEVNFYAERQYNSFLPLLPIWKLALNVLAIGYMMNLPVSFWKSLMEIILSMSDHVILLLPLILDTGETLPSSAGECIQTTYDGLHCTSMDSWMFNLIVWTDHHSILWKRHIYNYRSRFYGFVLDPERLGKIEILKVVFETTWSLHGME